MEFSHYQIDSLNEQILSQERCDVSWHMIGMLNDHSDKPKYSNLAKAMLGILTIPHSNADSERAFSTVRKNRTDFRPSLSYKTLSRLCVQKSCLEATHTNCYEQKFSKEFLQKAKSATYESLNKDSEGED